MLCHVYIFPDEDPAETSTDGIGIIVPTTSSYHHEETEMSPLSSPTSHGSQLAVERGSTANERRHSDGAYAASPMTPMEDETPHPTPANDNFTPRVTSPTSSSPLQDKNDIYVVQKTDKEKEDG